MLRLKLVTAVLLAISWIFGFYVDSRFHEGSSAESFHSKPDWNGDNHSVGLSPPVGNLATNSIISTNATCGRTGAENYCKLLEHTNTASRGPNIHTQCQICDARSPDTHKRHSIGYAIDGSNRWWQSPTLQNGHKFEWVTITLDLKQIYQVAYIVIKAANTPRPANWILERSFDNSSYTPWQYYASSDEECWNRYGILAKPGKPSYDHDDEVICTSYFSKISPFEGGEIHTSLVNGRPGANGPTETLIKFTMARYVRLRLQKISTLKADLMRSDGDVKRRYFYSIKDIAIGGHCVCFGHSSECERVDPDEDKKCLCKHNTCGERCDACCPLFNQRPWSPGNSTTSASCEPCQCFGHSDSCIYDVEVDRRGLSLNKQGIYSGGGVCQDCKAYTSGINCEKCREGYYRPRGVLLGDPTPCIKCQCNSPGSTGSCVSQHENPGKRDGECICKPGYSGKTCTECAVGFRGFPMCEPCPCDIAGIVNSDCEGECRCKRNVDGRFCSSCKKGFFNLEKSNQDGCTPCFCNGFPSECNSTSLPITEISDQGSDWFLTDLSGHRKVSAQKDGQVWQVHNDEVAGFDNYYWTAMEPFTGKKLSSYGLKLTFFVSWIKARGDTSGRPIPEFDVIIQGASITLAYSYKFYEGNNATISVTMNDHHCFLLTEMDNTVFRDNIFQRDTPCTRYDVMKVLSDIKRVLLRGKFHTDQIESMLHYARLESAGLVDQSGRRAMSVEVCACPEGYAGNSCDECVPGYQKTNKNYPLNECIKCNCNGHSQSCDSIGNCLNCQNYTTGKECHACVPGYFRNALARVTEPCRQCACPLALPTNNFSPTCHATETSFVCNACSTGHEGLFCERCSNGYFGNPEKQGDYCKPCTCKVTLESDLSKTGETICDRHTGECFICPNNTFGWDCTQCKDGFFGNSTVGCSPCRCEYSGSLGVACHKAIGQCNCRANFQGLRCDTCVDGYTLSKENCVPCDCDPSGSETSICDKISGQCRCKPGVAGKSCNECGRLYFGFSSSGCRSCDPCDIAGHICDLNTGRCVCPPNSEGKFCEKCTVGFYGIPSEGCKACNCSQQGSSIAQCSSSGQCLCAPGYAGRTCNTCEFGYFNYPKCTPCGCDASGTIVSYCREDGTCSCSETGQCSCKANVIGQKCDKCKTGSYDLRTTNPSGCESCFCFHRTNKCSQGNFKWQQLALPSMREVQLSVNGKSQMKIINNLIVISDNGKDLLLAKDVSFGAPMYWQLPHIFLGDKVLSYKGLLRFHLSSESGRAIFPSHVLESYPLIQIQGNHRLVLEHFTNISQLVETYEVRLHEDSWRLRHGPSDGAVTKEIMMIALQNIQHILIRGTASPEIFNAKFFNVSLDTAVPISPGEEPMHTGLEVCECPSQYNSTSCQNPTAGYYRWHKHKFITSTVIIDLVGEAKPCECNGRSRVCDIETGYCQNCSSNTSGFHCDQCLTGYHGNPVDTCQPCPCPSENNNHADSCTQHSTNTFQCFCKPGYVGSLCERCDYGFFGRPGETCDPCECNPFGSVSDECDELTGQCNCRPGITGRDCSKCSTRHVIVKKTCVSCDDPCTGRLLTEIQELPTFDAELIRNAHMSLICDNLYFLENEWKYLDRQLNSMYFMGNMYKELGDMENHLSGALGRAIRLKSDCNTAVTKANAHRVTSNSLYARINLISKQIHDLIQMLESYNPGKRQPFGGRTNSLAEIKSLLGSIQLISFNFPLEEALFQQTKVNGTLEEAYALTSRHNFVIGNISQARDKLAELNLRINGSIENREQLKGILALATREMATKKNKSKVIQDFITDVHNLNSPNSPINRGYFKLTETSNIFDMLEDVLMDIQNNTYEIEITDNTLFEFIPIYRTLYAQPAFDHVQAQRERALEIKRLLETFSPGNEGAIKAAGVYGQIESFYHMALETARNASIVAKNANLKINLLLGNSLNGLEGLPGIPDANLIDQITSLRAQCKKTKAMVKSVHQRILETHDFLRTLSIHPEDVHMEFDFLTNTITDLQATMDEIMAKELDLRERFESAPFFASSIGNGVEGQPADHSGIRLRMNKFNQLYDQLKSRRRTDGLYNKVQYLKSLILQSKHKADTVRIGLGPDVSGTCLRLYKWKALPEATSIRFNFLPVLESDSLLVYWPSTLNEDFVAIEMVDRRIKASWELGSGLRTLTHPRKFRRIGESSDAQPCFKVSFERTGASASLNVVIETNTSSSLPIQYVAGTDEATVLDLAPNDLVHLGGMSKKERRSGIVSNGLSGCIHNLQINQKMVGLWNFVGNEGCAPCPECSDIAEGRIGKLDYFFDGTGYSSVNRIQSQTFYAKYFDISIEFRTRMNNGLIFLTMNNTMSQSISMELKDGQVVFQTCHSCNNGNERSSLQVETTGAKLNTGEWVQLRAIWIFQRGTQTAQLTVGKSGQVYKEEKKSKEITFDLYSAVYQIGGVSPVFQGHHVPAISSNSSFAGCIKNVLIDGTSYDMLSGNYFGVEAHCKDRDRALQYN